MDLHHLEYIVEIAREGNISRAARKLHLSQPTLSIYLNKLEESLNLKLFERTNNTLSITEAGEKYVDACIKILDIKDQLYKDLYEKDKTGVRLGVLRSNISLFQNVISEFKLKHSNVDIYPLIGKSEELTDRIRKGKLDFAFITSYARNLTEEFHDLNYQILQEYELVLLLSKNNPVYSQLTLDDGYFSLKDAPILERIGFNMTDSPMIRDRLLNDVLPSLNLHPKRMYTDNDTGFIITNLTFRDYFCIAPFSKCPEGIAQLYMEGSPKIHKLLIYSKNKKLTATERELLQMAAAEIRKTPYYYNLEENA